jgi:hypothetical protein
VIIVALVGVEVDLWEDVRWYSHGDAPLQRQAAGDPYLLQELLLMMLELSHHVDDVRKKFGT